MHPAETDFKRRLRWWGTLVVSANFLAVIGHLFLLVKLQPGFPNIAIVLLVLINMLPIAGVLGFHNGFPRLAGILILIPLGIALVIGGYTHLVSAGADNVLDMPPAPLRLLYQLSAILLVLLEAAGSWIAVRMFAFGR